MGETGFSTNRDPRIALEILYKEFRDLVYPPSNGDKEISGLNDLLVLYDADVAAAIANILLNQDPSAKLRHHTGLEENPQLEREIERLIAKYPSDHRIGRVARQYARYYDVIKKMLQAAFAYLNGGERE